MWVFAALICHILNPYQSGCKHQDDQAEMTLGDIKAMKKNALDAQANNLALSALILQMTDLQIKARMPLDKDFFVFMAFSDVYLT